MPILVRSAGSLDSGPTIANTRINLKKYVSGTKFDCEEVSTSADSFASSLSSTELPSHVDVNMPVMSCASKHKSHHWPDFIPMEENYQPVYNCLQYELSDGAHMVMSADAKGIHASGASAEEAIEDFRLAIKTRLVDKQGGLYHGRSEFEFQELVFCNMEQGWIDDGVQILQKRRLFISIFDGTVKSK